MRFYTAGGWICCQWLPSLLDQQLTKIDSTAYNVGVVFKLVSHSEMLKEVGACLIRVTPRHRCTHRTHLDKQTRMSKNTHHKTYTFHHNIRLQATCRSRQIRLSPYQLGYVWGIGVCLHRSNNIKLTTQRFEKLIFPCQPLNVILTFFLLARRAHLRCFTITCYVSSLLLLNDYVELWW